MTWRIKKVHTLYGPQGFSAIFNIEKALLIQEYLGPCETGSHDCPSLAICTPGGTESYSCKCLPHLTGHGQQCFGKKLSFFPPKLGALCLYVSTGFETIYGIFSENVKTTNVDLKGSSKIPFFIDHIMGDISTVWSGQESTSGRKSWKLQNFYLACNFRIQMIWKM